ncbi:MAG: type II secretion system F family protein [Candidatus Omnitrophota bacterium]
MKTFIYQLRDKKGRSLYGFERAADKRALRRKIVDKNLFFVSAQKTDRKKIFRQGISLTALSVFTHRLSSLVEAGIPILSALNVLWHQTEDKQMQLVISYLTRRLEQGARISEAMASFPNVFPPVYRALVGIAEKSGGLVEILRRLVIYLEYQRNLIMRTRKAMFYPIVVLVFSLLILIGMFVFVVPVFQRFLEKLNVELPLLTRAVLNVSAFLRNPFAIAGIFLLIAAGYFVHRYIKSSVSARQVLDRMKLRIPFYGNILYTSNMSRFVNAFSLMVGAGLPLLESFQAAASTVDNRSVYKSIDRVRARVEQGMGLHESFDRERDFPQMMVEMVGIGEQSGKISRSLDRMAQHFDEDVDYKLNRGLTLLEPALIVVVGVMVLLTLMAIYLPVVSMWQGLSGG